MIETLLSAAGGGLFGLIGAGFTKFMDWKKAKLMNQHQVAMAEQDRLNMVQELELAKVQGAIDLELLETTTDAVNLQSALKSESAITGTSQWVADLRGSLRPIITYVLVVMAFSIALIDSDNAHVNEIIFMAMTAVTFWFGSRPQSKK